MNKFYLLPGKPVFFTFIFTFLVIISRGQDLPGASANLTTAPAGSYVIAMDHANQATSNINAATGTYLFNLKAYGLAVFLLDVSYKLKWVIAAGKSKDAIDFSASAERIAPSYLAAQTYNFKAGPFLIFPADTLGAANVIRQFNQWMPDSCKVKVYRLQDDVTVDVRYNLNKPPRGALLDDSCDIHKNYMEMASVLQMNYDCLPNASTLRTGCYTFATEAHAVPGDLTSYDADSIYNFVLAGGNFLAECEAVQTFENLKKFHSVSGAVVDPTGGQYNNFNNNVYYDNADMAYGQYEGSFRPWLRGAQKVWRYGSANANNWYSVTSSQRNAVDNLHFVASISKMTSDTGSLVFYLGNHEYFTHDCHTCTSGSTVNEQEINGIRLFLNAFLMPSKFMNCVNIYNVPLAVKLEEFLAFKQDDGNIKLNWTSLSEKHNSWYLIEHSVNGRDFNMIGRTEGKGDTEDGHSYDFLHTSPQKGLNYYRLKMISMTGIANHSEIRRVVLGTSDKKLYVFPNPAYGTTRLQLDAKDGERVQVKLIDVTGRLVKKELLIVTNQQTEMNLKNLGRGIYWILAVAEDGQQFKTRVMIME